MILFHGLPVYIYAEKVYHRDIRDYGMNKKRRENLLCAVLCLPRFSFLSLLLEKKDAQIQLARVGFMPVTDTRSIIVGGNSRPVSDAQQRSSDMLILRTSGF
jgi:hypothetical protein